MRRKIIIGAGVLAGIVLIGFLIVILVVSTYNYNKFKPEIIEITQKYTGRKLTLAGNINVKASLYPTLQVNNVSFQNAPWSAYPEMIHAKRVEVQLALIPLIKGNIDIKRLILINPDVILEIDKAGQTNLEFNAPRQPKAKPAPANNTRMEAAPFALKAIMIRDGKLTVKNHQKNQTFVLIIHRFVESSEKSTDQMDINLEGAFNDIPLNVSGKVGTLAGITDPAVPFPVDLKAKVGRMAITIIGKIQNPLAAKGIDVKFMIKGNDLSDIEAITKEPLPLAVKGPYDLSGHLVAATPSKLQVTDIMIQLADSRLNGSATLDLITNPPRISANMVSKTLDLRPLLMTSGNTGTGGKEKTAASKNKSKKLFEDRPLKLDFMHRINGAVDLRIEQLLVPKLALDNVETKIRLLDGNLSVDPLTAGIGGGQLSSRLIFQAQKNTADVDLNMDIKQMDIGEMLKKLQITKDVDGILDIDVHFIGRGNSVAAIMAGSNGKVVATLGQGKIPMGYLNYISADIGSSFMNLINPFNKKIDHAKINCAVCDFHIHNGIAKSKVIIIDDPQLTLFSQGTVNLKTEALDFHIETKPKKGIGTKETGKLSISLSKITKPFKLSGTLTHPALGIDLMSTATTIGAALLGPVGWAYLLVSGSSGNPCKKALEIAEKDTAGAPSKTQKEKATKPGTEEQLKKFGNKILNIFK
jgi:AsmA family protein